MEVPGIGKFEGYPNRDSMPFIDYYGIQETKTMQRGTYRNLGWCETLKKVADLGLFSIEDRNFRGMTYAEMMSELTNAESSESPIDATARTIGLKSDDPIVQRLEWLGLFSDQEIPSDVTTYLDSVCYLFEQKLQYAPGERDMLVMHHEFIAEYPDRSEKITSTMIDYGIPNGDSSMSRTVALPVAIASRMILERSVDLVGVHRPVMPEFYEPILKELETLGIKLEERTVKL
jgi:saccharopine dehydrogenase (NADP+, L-glutamate forming)